MAEVLIRYHQCDCCGSKFKERKGNLVKFGLPCKWYDDDNILCTVHNVEYDLCEECYNKFADIVHKNFAEISTGPLGNKFEPVIDTSKWYVDEINK